MLDRRSFLGGAALAVAAPATLAALPDVAEAATTRLAAALNRTTWLSNPRQPDTGAAGFYRAARTNHYARLVHAATAGGAGYAFPDDDVKGGGVQRGGPGGLRHAPAAESRGRLTQYDSPRLIRGGGIRNRRIWMQRFIP